MAENKKANGKRKSGSRKFKIVVEKIHKSLLLATKKSGSTSVANDVKEGHFAVIAEDEYDSKRLIVPLSCLAHPSFLILLEQAEEEYGFDHEGALTIPCRPSELERILADGGCMESSWARVIIGET
ncbi:hypothetical protein Leryth_000724 [Lithospermum erythrorhizon]|uniref:Uncharacterized protein n=1 Tax=Lithospermum erythrorhizon TaxID=34254 RepID=A0AAV3RGE7_LITER|nr:hypothetical protein Leryth_000724 [Lithospermum erythrorhizon]